MSSPGNRTSSFGARTSVPVSERLVAIAKRNKLKLSIVLEKALRLELKALGVDPETGEKIASDDETVKREDE